MGHFVIDATAGRIRIIHHMTIHTDLEGEDVLILTASADIFFHFPEVQTWLDEVAKSNMNAGQEISSPIHCFNFSLRFNSDHVFLFLLLVIWFWSGGSADRSASYGCSDRFPYTV